MKILTLTDNIYPYSEGGAEMAAYRLAGGYLENGHENIIVTATQKRELAGEEKLVNGARLYKIYANYHDRWRGLLSLWNPVLLWRLKKILRKEKPDIAHIHNIHKYFSYACLKMLRRLGIPTVMTIHDCMPICYKKFTCFIEAGDIVTFPGDLSAAYKINSRQCRKCQRWRYWLYPWRNDVIRRFFNEYPSRVVAVSAELEKLLKINDIRCDGFIHHGVKIDDFQVDEKAVKEFITRYRLTDKKVIFFGGRVSYAKGFEHLMGALKLVIKKHTDAVLLIAGKKTDYLNDLMMQSDLRQHVVTAGWLNQKDLISAYACSDLVISPSICFDTFGLINLEAMAMKKSVITSCFGGGREIVINNVTGYVINPLDISDMADKIKDLLGDGQKAKIMGEAGYQRARENFDFKKEVAKYLEIFKSLV